MLFVPGLAISPPPPVPHRDKHKGDKPTSASVTPSVTAIHVEDHQIHDFLPPPRLAAVLLGGAAINVSLLTGRVGLFKSS